MLARRVVAVGGAPANRIGDFGNAAKGIVFEARGVAGQRRDQRCEAAVVVIVRYTIAVVVLNVIEQTIRCAKSRDLACGFSKGVSARGQFDELALVAWRTR